VTHYYRQGQRAVEEADPLGPSIPVAVCGNCQHVETVNPGGPACPTCAAAAGNGEREYRTLDLRQPKGFYSSSRWARDYDGSFDFVPRAARPKVGRPPFAINPHLNLQVGAGVGSLYVINDNGGNLYHLARVWPNSQAKIDIAAAQTADAKFAASEGRRAPPLRLTALENPIACALAAISETDMMLLGIRDFGPGRGADPRTPQGRAALYSLAFMLRRAAAVLLDIHDYELKSGIRSIEDPAAGVSGQIFLSDTLENGAGYATHLGQPAVAEHLLRLICEPGHNGFFRDASRRPSCRQLRHVVSRLPAQLQQPPISQPPGLETGGRPRVAGAGCGGPHLTRIAEVGARREHRSAYSAKRATWLQADHRRRPAGSDEWDRRQDSHASPLADGPEQSGAGHGLAPWDEKPSGSTGSASTPINRSFGVRGPAASAVAMAPPLVIEPLASTSPTLADEMKLCWLRAGLASCRESASWVLHDPRLWLGTALHSLLEKARHEHISDLEAAVGRRNRQLRSSDRISPVRPKVF